MTPAFFLARYRAYDPCFMSEPWPPADVALGRHRVIDVFVLLPRVGTYVSISEGLARSLDWFQFTFALEGNGLLFFGPVKAPLTFIAARVSVICDDGALTCRWMTR